MLQLHVLDAAGGLAADVVVVVGLAADHRAERDDRRVAAALGRIPADQRQLEGAGHLEAVDLGDAGLLERVARALLERVRELLVEARDAQRNAVVTGHRRAPAFVAEFVADLLVVQHLLVEREPLVVQDVAELVALGAQVGLVVRVGAGARSESGR